LVFCFITYRIILQGYSCSFYHVPEQCSLVHNLNPPAYLVLPVVLRDIVRGTYCIYSINVLCFVRSLGLWLNWQLFYSADKQIYLILHVIQNFLWYRYWLKISKVPVQVDPLTFLWLTDAMCFSKSVVNVCLTAQCCNPQHHSTKLGSCTHLLPSGVSVAF
jgi:hypothetical protein